MWGGGGVAYQNRGDVPPVAITNPGTNVPKSRCIEGAVFVFKAFGCR